MLMPWSATSNLGATGCGYHGNVPNQLSACAHCRLANVDMCAFGRVSLGGRLGELRHKGLGRSLAPRFEHLRSGGAQHVSGTATMQQASL